MKPLLLILAALALTGCATTEGPSGPYTGPAFVPQYQPYYIPPNTVSQPVYRAPMQQRTTTCMVVPGTRAVQCY